MAVIFGDDGNNGLHPIFPPDLSDPSTFSDQLYGLGGNDTLTGGIGEDWLYGGPGDDTYFMFYDFTRAGYFEDNDQNDHIVENAGEGVDTVAVAGTISAFTIPPNVENLTFDPNFGAFATDFFQRFTAVGNELDNIISVGDDFTMEDPSRRPSPENWLYGLDGNDTLNGSRWDDVLIGSTGNDVLNGESGADQLDGGPGNDWASYTAAATRVIANLANPASNTGDAAGDTYISIEGLRGSDFNDALIGDANDNTLEGGAGADVLTGGMGNDTLTGGAGGDRFVYAPRFKADTITDFSAAEGDEIDLSGFTAIHSFAQIQVLATQVGVDTVFNFGNGDTLTLTGVTTAALTPGNFLLEQVTFLPPILASNIFGAGAAAGGWVSQDQNPRVLGDVNGDGRADIVGFGFGGTFTALGQADGTFAAPLLASNIFGSSAAAGGWFSQDQATRLLSDVNGDGRADIVGFGFAGTYTALGQADGTFAAPLLASNIFGSSTAAGGWFSQDQATRLLSDVNGDGRADIVGFGFGGTFTALGQADGTFAAPLLASNIFGSSAAAGGWFSQDQNPRLLGDVNGDGRADIVGFGFGGTYTALGQADGTFAAAILASNVFGTSTAAGGWFSQDQNPRLLGDVNGDGRADIVGFGFGGTYTALGQADGTFDTPVFDIADYGSSDAAGGWTSDNTYPRFAADVTGDHLVDLVGFGYSGVFVSQTQLV